jgi:hypothetical protein
VILAVTRERVLKPGSDAVAVVDSFTRLTRIVEGLAAAPAAPITMPARFPWLSTCGVSTDRMREGWGRLLRVPTHSAVRVEPV